MLWPQLAWPRLPIELVDHAEKAQRLARRLIQAAIGRALRAELGSERHEVPAHIRNLLNQCEQKPDNKQR
jgi:hypothetical protein